MNVGEKWKLSSGDTIYEIEQVSCDRRFLTMREGNGDLLSLDTHGLTSSYLEKVEETTIGSYWICLLYTSPSPRDRQKSRMPSSA